MFISKSYNSRLSYLIWQNEIVNVIKDLEMGYYPGLFVWAQTNDNGLIKKTCWVRFNLQKKVVWQIRDLDDTAGISRTLASFTSLKRQETEVSLP